MMDELTFLKSFRDFKEIKLEKLSEAIAKLPAEYITELLIAMVESGRVPEELNLDTRIKELTKKQENQNNEKGG